jgi:citrate lyase beta subunit
MSLDNVDALILDLEDSVATHQKVGARSSIVEALNVEW